MMRPRIVEPSVRNFCVLEVRIRDAAWQRPVRGMEVGDPAIDMREVAVEVESWREDIFGQVGSEGEEPHLCGMTRVYKNLRMLFFRHMRRSGALGPSLLFRKVIAVVPRHKHHFLDHERTMVVFRARTIPWSPRHDDTDVHRLRDIWVIFHRGRGDHEVVVGIEKIPLDRFIFRTESRVVDCSRTERLGENCGELTIRLKKMAAVFVVAAPVLSLAFPRTVLGQKTPGARKKLFFLERGLEPAACIAGGLPSIPKDDGCDGCDKRRDPAHESNGRELAYVVD
ncbi:hypothetical protein DFH06DRAFT_1185393 [Mycena polygramma]|nr:hypothetical protein DFH06DRAFT_1185393 [Mycena polygramma]